MAVTYTGGPAWTTALADANKDVVNLPAPASTQATGEEVGVTAASEVAVVTVGGADEVSVVTPEGLIRGPQGQEASTIELGPGKAYTAITLVTEGIDWHIV